MEPWLILAEGFVLAAAVFVVFACVKAWRELNCEQ